MKKLRQMERKGCFTLNNQCEVDVHHRLLLFAIFYRSFRFRPQISFRLAETLFTSAGFGSGPSEVKKKTPTKTQQLMEMQRAWSFHSY